MTLQSATRLGPYEITSLLGSGGMGEVYRAKDHKLGRDVAIKVLREELASDPERLRRFEQEARSASALNHPNIITIYDIGKHGATPYIAMEYVEGKTLREMLGEGPLPTKKLLQLATQIAEGLAKAHSAGIVHRDLKPENLMVSSDGYVKILDFGLAKLRTQPSGSDSEAVTATKEGTVLGTVGYMSPEQAKGQPADFRSDQFSFGAILYEMVTGRRAFQRDSSVQTLSAIIDQEPASIAALHPETPPHLRAIVERCLAKNSEERYDSTRDLARELKSIGEIATPLPSEPTAAPIEKRRTWRRIVAIAGGLAAVLALALALNVGSLRDWLTGGPSPLRINSIAVLPLENLSGDPEQEYFADGMTEALIADLAKIGALRVISRQSVMQFKRTATPLPEIARTLNVDAVVEGSVLRSEDRVRITTQLVQATPERHLWAESYERDLENVLALQSEVARAIAAQIQVAVSPEEARQLAPSPRVNPEAYRLYLQGNYHLGRRTTEALQNAQAYFQQAIQADPEYAPSHAGLAAALTALGGWNGILPPSAVHVPAKAAAQKALELDGTLAEGHITLARIKELFEWDWAGAETAFKQGIQLGPSSTTARIVYANYLTAVGRFEVSIRIGTHTLEIDPLLPLAYQELGFAFHAAGRDGEALDMYRKTLELDPEMRSSHALRPLLYLEKGMIAESIPEVDELNKLVGYAGPPYRVGQLGYLLGKTGRRTEALSALSELRKRAETDYVPASAIGLIYLGLGRPEAALGELERAFAQHDVCLVWLKVHPIFNDLRSDPRFQDLLRRMNFPE